VLEESKMSIFNKIPWKVIGGFVPALAEIAKQAKDYAGNGEISEIEELKKRVASLEAEKDSICKSFKFMLVSGIVIFLISVAGLVLGIIALAR
jgi:hypothetical protein